LTFTTIYHQISDAYWRLFTVIFIVWVLGKRNLAMELSNDGHLNNKGVIDLFLYDCQICDTFVDSHHFLKFHRRAEVLISKKEYIVYEKSLV